MICEGVRVGRVVRVESGSICTSLCLLRRELSNEWQYHGVSMCEDGDGVSNTHHFVSPSYKDGDCSGVLALLNDQHAILCSTKRQLPYDAGFTELFSGQLRETWDDSPPCCYGNELYLGPAHPADGRKLIGQKKVVCFVVKSPLAYREIGSCVLHLAGDVMMTSSQNKL